MDNFDLKKYLAENKLPESVDMNLLGTMRNQFDKLSVIEMQEFIYHMYGWFLRNANELSNMDAKGISQLLFQAAKKIEQRKGN